MKIFVQHRRSFIVPLMIILVFITSAAAGWKYVQKQQAQTLLQIDTLSRQIVQLREDKRLLLAGKRQAESKVDMLQQTGVVDAQAYAKVNDHLKSLQQEIVDLKENIAFYRDIVASSNKGSVNIKSFEIRHGIEVRSFKYQLVLTRGTRGDKVIEGQVDVSVEGDIDGRKMRLAPRELGLLDATALAYQFKYFQRLEGRFFLPEKFSPTRIIVKLTATANPKRPLLKSFDWAAINS